MFERIKKALGLVPTPPGEQTATDQEDVEVYGRPLRAIQGESLGNVTCEIKVVRKGEKRPTGDGWRR